MCLAIPGKIVALAAEGGPLAVVEVSGVRRKINVDLLEDAAPGDWVLIHVGFAMSKISAAEAEEQMRLLSMLGEDGEAMAELEGYRFADGEGAARVSARRKPKEER